MHRFLTRAGRAVVLATVVFVLGAASVAAHTQTVTPNGNGDGPDAGRGISRPWAMAHCQAASPLIIAERSNGVVQFQPAQPFENCEPGTRGQGD